MLLARYYFSTRPLEIDRTGFIDNKLPKQEGIVTIEGVDTQISGVNQEVFGEDLIEKAGNPSIHPWLLVNDGTQNQLGIIKDGLFLPRFNIPLEAQQLSVLTEGVVMFVTPESNLESQQLWAITDGNKQKLWELSPQQNLISYKFSNLDKAIYLLISEGRDTKIEKLIPGRATVNLFNYPQTGIEKILTIFGETSATDVVIAKQGGICEKLDLGTKTLAGFSCQQVYKELGIKEYYSEENVNGIIQVWKRDKLGLIGDQVRELADGEVVVRGAVDKSIMALLVTSLLEDGSGYQFRIEMIKLDSSELRELEVPTEAIDDMVVGGNGSIILQEDDKLVYYNSGSENESKWEEVFVEGCELACGYKFIKFEDFLIR